MATITAKAIATSNNTYAGWVNGGSITFDDFTSGDKSQDAGSLLVNPSELEKIPVGSIINSVTLCYTSKVNKDQYKAGIYVTPYYLTSYTITGNTYTYTGASKAGDKIHSTQSNSTSGYDGSVPLGAWDVSKIKSGMRLAMGIDVKKSSITIIPCDLTISNIRVVIDYTIPTYIFDLNGSLDGGDPNSNISGWGTADVYINGALSSWEEKPSSGVNDFYGSFDYGTTYEVKNIVANSGYKYVGNSSYSGTLTSNTTIVLPFETTSTNMTYIGTKQPTFYLGTRQVQSIYLGMTLIYKVALLKVTATFSYLNDKDEYVDLQTEVYYGASVEEFANGITDYKLPENDKNCHYINNGWVDFYGKSTLQSVREDTTFVLSVSSEAHNIDPTIAGYDKKEPTCTEDGYIKGYCGYCAGQKDGYKGLIQIDLKATGHTDTDDDGICDVCGESIVTIVDSGTCGSNLTYTLDSNGVLTISGTGDMQDSSFGWDKNLIKSVVINDGVTSIGKEAFKNCTNLTSITIPDCITSIGDSAFYGCTKLTSITIPNSVTSIGNSAFDNCTGLTSVIIPGSVTSIGRYAFLQCTGLTSITISDGVTSIGSSAFAYCKSLTSVTIPDSVTSIEGNVIYGCTVLIGITVSSGNTVYHSTGNCLIETGSKTLISGCKSSIIPADGSVTSINRSAFLNCKGLTSITIPDSVTSIGESAFYGCTGLTEVDFSTCTDIPTLESSNVFSNTPSNLAIKVPSVLLDQWKSATNWSTYADKIMGVRL